MRQPRGLVKVNGEELKGWTSWEVKNSSTYTADDFRIEISLSAQPPNRPWSWWVSQQQLQIEVFGGFPADPLNYGSDDLTSFIRGYVDLIDSDPGQRTLVLSGRDMSAQLIDNKTDQKWPNLTSSQIVAKVAAQFGLTPQVTATTTKTGTYYDIDHVTVTTERSYWDLLSYLAQREGFRLGVNGSILSFGPAPTDTSPYIIQWQEPQPLPSSNTTHINFSRNLTLARDVIVKVRSWNMTKKAAYTKTATVKHKAGSPGQPQVYSYVIAGLTPDQCQQKAQSLALAISQHEVRMNMEAPGDTIPVIADTLQVQGTGTDYDQVYYPESISRSLSLGEGGGFRMAIKAKNTLPVSVELL